MVHLLVYKKFTLCFIFSSNTFLLSKKNIFTIIPFLKTIYPTSLFNTIKGIEKIRVEFETSFTNQYYVI